MLLLTIFGLLDIKTCKWEQTDLGCDVKQRNVKVRLAVKSYNAIVKWKPYRLHLTAAFFQPVIVVSIVQLAP